MIKPITGTANFDAAIAKGDVIVGFSAPWCGFCRKIRPVMEKLSGEMDIPFYGINIDEDKELAERYNVETIPDIFFFRSFKEAGITMAVDTKVMNHVRNNRKKPLVNRPDVTVTVSVPQSLINTDDVLFPYGNPFP